MPKGYMIVRMTVADAEAYKAYAELATAAIRQYGGRPLVRGGRAEQVEGEGRPRNVVLEFASFDDVRTFYHSPEYQAAVRIRHPISTGEVVLVEGVA